MDKFKVQDINEKEIIFSSLHDMEAAYNQLANGIDIMIFKETDKERMGEILSGKIFSEIMDGKFKLLSKEKI